MKRIKKQTNISFLCFMLSMLLPSLVCAQTSFMVMSDMHVLDKSLFDGDASFDDDPKVVEHSQALFDKAISIVSAAKPDFLLITGDLSKDGEKASHEYVSAKLKALVSSGIKVYVIPGNHDIDNPNAKSYLGGTSAKTSSISAEDFSSVYYNDCGYSSAVATNGLSYMVYPNDNLAIICLDSRKPDTPSAHYSEGGLTEATISWAESAAATAIASGRRVIGMMHHPVVEHFDDHASLAPTYIANQSAGYPQLSYIQQRLVSAGISVMFTGHYHLQSVSKAETTSGALFDVMTGSVCSYPFPLRKGTIGSTGEISFVSEILTLDGVDLVDIGKKRNENTTKGMFSVLANKLYPKMLSKKEAFENGSTAEKSIASLIKWPASSSEIYAGMNTYMFDSFKELINDLSAGDEHLGNPKAGVTACTNGVDKYFSSLFTNPFYAGMGLALLKNMDEYKQMTNMINSVYYNYVGSKDNVIPDNANTVYQSCMPNKIKLPASESYVYDGHWGEQTFDVTLNRSFANDGGKYSFIVPFDIDAATASSLGKFYEYDRIDNDRVYFKEVEDGIKANQGYFFVPSSDVSSISISNVELHPSSSIPDATSPGENGIYGTYKLIGLPENAFGYGTDGHFTKAVGTGNKIMPYRAYLWLGDKVSNTKIKASFGDDADNIIQLKDGEIRVLSNAPIYNPHGQRIATPQRGEIYIQNGKKLIHR